MFIGKTYPSNNRKKKHSGGNEIKNAVKHKKELIKLMQLSEILFNVIAENMGITYLKPQHIIYIRDNKRRIQTHRIADYCDTKNKIIFEIDGKQHYNDDGSLVSKDIIRNKQLEKRGYKIYRLRNEEVAEKAKELLESIYC